MTCFKVTKQLRGHNSVLESTQLSRISTGLLDSCLCITFFIGATLSYRALKSSRINAIGTNKVSSYTHSELPLFQKANHYNKSYPSLTLILPSHITKNKKCPWRSTQMHLSDQLEKFVQNQAYINYSHCFFQGYNTICHLNVVAEGCCMNFYLFAFSL